MAALQEFEQSALPQKSGKRYILLVCVILALLGLVKTYHFSGGGLSEGRFEMVDFDSFYLSGLLVGRDKIDDVYNFIKLAEYQKEFSGEVAFLPWTYPPQFDVLVAVLAMLPKGLAYLIFMAATLAGYLLGLSRIAGARFPLILLLSFPYLCINLGCGQNGFLSGGLIVLTCLAFSRNSGIAGIPLGLMIIKPHLAVVFAALTAFDRRWRIAAVAALTIGASSICATLLLGEGVWAAFLDGVRQSGILLRLGAYPLYRMVSAYATARSLGVPASISFVCQGVAALSLIAVIFACRNKPMRLKLGLVAVASPLISPYAYDYDVTILIVGLAYLIDHIIEQGREGERWLVYGLVLLPGLVVFGEISVLSVTSAASAARPFENHVASAAAPCFLVLFALLSRLALRAPDAVRSDEAVWLRQGLELTRATPGSR